MGGGVSRRRTSGNSALDNTPEKVKLVVLGAAGVGKTVFFRRLMGDLAQDNDGEEYTPSTKANIGAKLVHLEGLPSVVIEVWDVPFQLFAGRAILERYVAGANGFVLMYSLSSAQLESSSRVALEFIRMNRDPSVKVVVVGNKRDLRSKSASTPSYMELCQLCEHLGITHTKITTHASAVEVTRAASELLRERNA